MKEYFVELVRTRDVWWGPVPDLYRKVTSRKGIVIMAEDRQSALDKFYQMPIYKDAPSDGIYKVNCHLYNKYRDYCGYFLD